MAASNAEKIAAKIKELPPLPLVVQKLLAIVGDGNSSAKDVTRVLSSDQALAAKVLKLVNSSFYGFSREISTITRAVVILGFSAVRNLALGMGAIDTLKKVQGDFDWAPFWKHCIGCAAASQAVATRVGYGEPEEAFIAGLLHDIGHFVFGLTMPEQFREVVEKADSDIDELEEEAFGLKHVDVGIRLLEHWKLPENLCRVARFHHSSKTAKPEKDSLTAIVMLADQITSVSGGAYASHLDTGLFLDMVSDWKLPLGYCAQTFVEIDSKVSEAQTFLNIPVKDNYQYGRGRFACCWAAVVASERGRREWIEGVLGYLGVEVVEPDVLAKTTNPDKPFRFVLVDNVSVEPAISERLADCYMGRGVEFAALDDTQTPLKKLASGKVCRGLPLVFNGRTLVKCFPEIAGHISSDISGKVT